MCAEPQWAPSSQGSETTSRRPAAPLLPSAAQSGQQDGQIAAPLPPIHHLPIPPTCPRIHRPSRSARRPPTSPPAHPSSPPLLLTSARLHAQVASTAGLNVGQMIAVTIGSQVGDHRGGGKGTRASNHMVTWAGDRMHGVRGGRWYVPLVLFFTCPLTVYSLRSLCDHAVCPRQ